jgi:hypothetical protein
MAVTYSTTEDGVKTATFTGSGELTESTVIDHINDATVAIIVDYSSIGAQAFYRASSLTYITIPASVQTIGQDAFYRASGLASVTFEAGSQLTSIGEQAFAYASSLTSIAIPAGVTSIGERAFFRASALTSITVNSNNTHYKDIDGVLFNKDGTTLIQYPTGNNTRTTYEIPSSVSSTENRAFWAASALTSFTVNSNNTHYKAINGVLFNKDGTTLVKYPDSNTRTTYTIPDGVTTIDIFSFREAPNLTSIAIPASVSPILYSHWLYGSPGLTTIYASQDLIDTMGWTRSDSTVPPTLNTISGISDITVSTDQPPPSPICFPAGTPVTTDQGLIAIEKLNTDKHTIRGKEIIAITQTRPLQKHIVCFGKDSLSKNVPSQETCCSMEHKVFYKGEMMKARDIVKLCENVSFIPYNGETLYNVLLKKQDKMMINNLICETLDPKNIMAKISTIKDGQKKSKAIQELTKILKNNNIPGYHKLYASL